MKNFFIDVEPTKDKRVQKYLDSFNSVYWNYGIFEVYKTEEGLYRADHWHKIIIDSKIKNVYILCMEEMILYGKVRVASRTRESIKFKYDNFAELEYVTEEIKKLQKTKKELYEKMIAGYPRKIKTNK